MRFFLPFFCLFLLSACQDNPAPDADYEDDFLLVAHQEVTRGGDGFGQDMQMQALVSNRIADGPDSGLWIRTTLPWLRIGSGDLDTRDLDRLGDRAAPLRDFLSTGTLSKVEDGTVTESRIADPALHDKLVERFGDKVDQLLDQATAASVPLPDDPRPGDTWEAEASLWGLPRVEAAYEVLARDGDRLLVSLLLDGEGVEGQARMVVRRPSGMPEALRLHSILSLPDQDATLEQRLMLISQRHHPYPVRAWDVEPSSADMYADLTERRLQDPIFTDPGDLPPLKDHAELDTLLEGLENSLFYRPDEHRLLTRGDWQLAVPLQQQASLHFTGFDGQAPDGLALNRLAESSGFFGLAETDHYDFGRDLLIRTGNGGFQPGEPITLSATARIFTASEPHTLTPGDDSPEGLTVSDWEEDRVTLVLDGAATHWRIVPLDDNGEPLPFAGVHAPLHQQASDAATFVRRLDLTPPPTRLTLLTKGTPAGLRLQPMEGHRRELTFTVRPLPEQPGLHPEGVRHQPSPLPPLPDDTEALLQGLETHGLDDNRLRVTGPPGLRLCALTPEDGAEYQGTPLHFTWDHGDRDTPAGFELRTEDDQIRYFYGRELAFQARCPSDPEAVTLTPEQPGCATFDGDNGVRVGDDCQRLANLDYAALDDTGLALQPLGEDDDGVRHFWGRIKEVRFLRADQTQQRDLRVTFPELPQ